MMIKASVLAQEGVVAELHKPEFFSKLPFSKIRAKKHTFKVRVAKKCPYVNSELMYVY